MSAVGAATPAATGSTWTFTQGLILGQASFLFLCLLFIRYVVFSPSEPVDADSWRRKREERAKVSWEPPSLCTSCPEENAAEGPADHSIVEDGIVDDGRAGAGGGADTGENRI